MLQNRPCESALGAVGVIALGSIPSAALWAGDPDLQSLPVQKKAVDRHFSDWQSIGPVRLPQHFSWSLP